MSRKIDFQLIGWILFTLCAILYIISSLEANDWMMLGGSLLFLLACILFLIGYFTESPHS